MLYALGAGPLDSDRGRFYTRLIAGRASATTLRDDESQALLQAAGADVSTSRVTADPAFLVRSAPPEWLMPYLRHLHIPPGARVVAVAVRHWDVTIEGTDWMSEIAAALDEVAADGTLLLFVPFQSASPDELADEAAAAQVVSRMARPEAVRMAETGLRAGEVQALFGAAQVVLAMRLHAVILAANSRTPVVGLSYDPKVAHTMRRLGLADYTVELPHATRAGVVERLRAAAARRGEIAASLDAVHRDLECRARENFAAGVALLRQRPAPLPKPTAEWTTFISDVTVRQLTRAAVAEAQREPLAREAAASA